VHLSSLTLTTKLGIWEWTFPRSPVLVTGMRYFPRARVEDAERKNLELGYPMKALRVPAAAAEAGGGA
jgi:hypothetical protein